MDQIYEAKVRLQADINGPLRGGENYQVGFYDAGIMRQILNHVGSGSYKIWAVPVPETQHEFEQVVEMLNNPDIQYALVDKSQGGHKIVFCIVDDAPGWMTVFDQLGYKVHSGPKTNKRLKSAHRPTLLNAHFDDLNIVIADPTDYTRYDFDDTEMSTEYGVAPWLATPDARARLLDGGFVISRRLIHEAVSNIPFYEPNDPIADHDYYYDPRVYQQMLEDLRNVSVVNARLIYKDGFLKGNAFVADLPEGVDVITTSENIKSEFTYENGFRFLAEPQGPKERVVTDPQTVINLPKLFTKTDLDFWLREEYKKMYNKAIDGSLLSNWQYVYHRTFRDDRNLEEDEARIRMIYVGYRWTAAGFKVTQSPWLFETTSISHAKPLKKSIPVPCAVYEQIVPESLARMAGYDYEVEEGTIIRCNELGVHVVNDLDWLEMYESHGGMDQDDFFKLFYRTMIGGDEYDGEKVVIVARSPNGYGEYSIFRYVEGQWAPTWHTADGEAIMFPEVDGNAWPVRLSQAILHGKVQFTGLPSQHESPEKRTGPYTKEDVIRDIKIAMSGGNVGGFVNAAMAHSMTIGTHRPVQLCTLETAIDKCINPDHIADVMAIDAETKAIMREVFDSGSPIDEHFFYKRGLKRYLRKNQTVTFYEGKISFINNICSEYFDLYCNSIRQWSQQNARPPEIVHKIGERLKYHAYPVLRNFRMKVFNTNSTEVTKSSGAIQRTAWESLYDNVVDKITSYERSLDSYDFVIALYSESINNPTSYGNVTDQIVMNRFVFPYLEEALQYYGLAKSVRREISGNRIRIVNEQVTSWLWTDLEGKAQIYTDPLEFQQAHAVESPISFVSPRPPDQRLTQSLY